MHGESILYAYGFWSLAVVNIALFAFFILSFLTPIKKREGRSMGVTLAFFVALFTEMYGFPLTIYILTGILGSKYPALNPFSHVSGHLWLTFLGGGATMMTILRFFTTFNYKPVTYARMDVVCHKYIVVQIEFIFLL